MMAMRLTGRDRILVARTVHPEYREVLATYAQHQGMPVVEVDYARDSGSLDTGDLEKKIDDQTAAVIIQSPNFFGIVEDRAARGRDRAPPRRAADLRFHRSRFTRSAGASARRRHRRGRTAIVRHLAQLRRPIRRNHRHQRKIHAPDAWPHRRRDQGHARQSRILSHAGGARTAHPPREGHFQHLHQSSSHRSDGHRLHDGLRQTRLARAGVCRTWPRPTIWPENCRCDSAGRSSTNSWSPRNPPTRSTNRCSTGRIIGGLPLQRYYPELENAMLLCATEMSRREDMDTVAEAFAGK